MPHHMPVEPESVQSPPKLPPPAVVSVRIGGMRFELDRIPRWLVTLLTSTAVGAIAYATHHHWR